MIPNNFKEWACSLSECDGGNIDADTWLCGIEWGGGSKGDYYAEMLPKEIENGACTPKQNIYDWKDSIAYPFGRSFAKLYSAIDGEISKISLSLCQKSGMVLRYLSSIYIR